MSVAQSLQNRVAAEAERLKNLHWQSPLPFDGYQPFCCVCERHDNILDYCDYKWKGQIFRFSSVAYPPSCDGLGKLVKDLQLQAKTSGGAELISKSGSPANFEKLSSKEQLCYRLECNCALIYRNASNKIDKENYRVNDSSQYRKATLHNDRQNDRTKTKGKKMSHRTSTARRLSKNDPKCPFSLSLYVDQVGFFMKGGVGNPNHQFHSRAEVNKVSKVRAALLTNEQRKEIEDNERAHVGKSTSRNMFYIRHGILLSRDQIRKIAKDVDIDPECDDIVEHLRAYFEHENARCCFLYEKRKQVPPGNLRLAEVTMKTANKSPSLLVNEVHDQEGGSTEISATNIDLNLSEGEAEDMAKYASGSRAARNIDESQDLLVAFAWVLPHERRQFSLYPFVVHIDGTNSTNIESRPLVTITGRDSLGNQFTVLRAFLPNNQAWIFKWLFQTVFPILLGKESLKRIVVIITDGDSQETSQVDYAIDVFFPQAIRVRCIWHIVDRGMDTHFPNCRIKKNTRAPEKRCVRAAFDKAELQVRHWIWSWAEPDCGTADEFQLSNALFLMFLESNEFAVAMETPAAVSQAKDFYNTRIYPHLGQFVFYKRKHLLHFDTNSNSAHEGTNLGLKNHAAPTNPQHTLEKATKVLTHQANLKALKLQSDIAWKVNSKMLWSDQPTKDKLVDLAVSLLTKE